MKNIVSTIIVFGSIFILIVAGAFIFDKFNGFGLIDNVDSSISNGIKKVLESEEENNSLESNYIKDNISDNTSDNNSKNLEITTIDNVSNIDIHSDNITADSVEIDNKNILDDNQTLDNNISPDNTTDGMSI